MNTLLTSGIEVVYHVAPLHYLPFIARSKGLKSKKELRSEGFEETHFRSKSWHLDVQRGFGDYVHLSTIGRPPILRAKLSAGFPHVCLSIPAYALNGLDFDLCRYNIAMTRKLRRGGKQGFEEGPASGRYYESKEIPIARTEGEQRQLIQARKGDMLEVLVKPPVPLPNNTQVFVFGRKDRDLSKVILEQSLCPWGVSLANTPEYQARPDYMNACERYIEMSLSDEEWRGNGLDYDKV